MSQGRPRVGSILCVERFLDGMECGGVCIAQRSASAVTYYKCKNCGSTKTVPRKEFRGQTRWLPKRKPEPLLVEAGTDSERQIKYQYGLDAAGFQSLMETQGGCCAICKRPPKTRRLVIDHCHDTGHVRGLLCSGCNTALGKFKDDPEMLRTAIQYLEMADTK